MSNFGNRWVVKLQEFIWSYGEYGEFQNVSEAGGRYMLAESGVGCYPMDKKGNKRMLAARMWRHVVNTWATLSGGLSARM